MISREHAKDLSWIECMDFKNKKSLDRFKKVIDKIYDDFEKEIQAKNDEINNLNIVLKKYVKYVEESEVANKKLWESI